MPETDLVDVAALHYLLWLRRDGHDTIRLNQNDLADELRLQQTTMSRIIRAMVNEGRLSRVSRGVYGIVDPATRNT